LLEYKGKTLLRHVISEAGDSALKPVVVVLGANADLVSKEIDPNNVHVLVNMDWKEGMASSIRVGLKTILKISSTADAVIFILCDQPFVSSSLLEDLMHEQIKTGKPIVASEYGNTIGPPALFHKNIFPELMKLKGDAGAKKIIQKHRDQVATVLFEKGNIDIDTTGDYEVLKSLS
jgi:molybdenum cofactor cytidylyltransferase